MDESKDNESINIPKAHQPSACTTTGCTMDADQLKVKCHECKRFTHYECTELPAYQLYVFKTGKRRCVCEMCAGPVPEDFLKCINQVNSNLQDVIKSLQETLSLKTDENNSFLEQIRDLKHQITVLKQKIKDTEHHALVTTQLDEHEVSHISPCVLLQTPRKVSEKDFLKSIETILETKLVNVEERLKQLKRAIEKSKRTMDNKLDTIMKDNPIIYRFSEGISECLRKCISCKRSEWL